MSILVIDVPFTTPSQNEYQRWHWGRQHEFLQQCSQLISCQLRNLGNPIPLWSPIPPRKFRSRMPCSARGCRAVPSMADPRGNRYCEEHFERRLRASRRAISIRRYSAGRLDRGNFVGGCKPLIDALVHVGVLYDDTEQWLDDRYEQHHAPPKEGRVEIEVVV